ncbi:hypothetical protein J2Z65_002469 [Paenibacillus aceris]|uniref:Uncharacterized protein n=1 Tax=Paenibacillus aceris TaxID=869555 RepID=A0ABS4HX95_9BACL|nr:hypothetical protein [Paenibacillus aceris]
MTLLPFFELAAMFLGYLKKLPKNLKTGQLSIKCQLIIIENVQSNESAFEK